MFNPLDFNTCILAQEIKPNGFETVRYIATKASKLDEWNSNF